MDEISKTAEEFHITFSTLKAKQSTRKKSAIELIWATPIYLEMIMRGDWAALREMLIRDRVNAVSRRTRRLRRKITQSRNLNLQIEGGK